MEIAYWYYANIQKTVLLFYCLLGRIQSTLLHAEKTSLSIYKGSEGWFLCLLYTFCPHILNSDFWVFPQSGRIVAIEGNNMLILITANIQPLPKPRWRTNSSHTIKIGKNDVPPSASSQNICIFQIFYEKYSTHYSEHVNNRHAESISSTHRLVWTGLLWWRSVLHFSELRLPARVLHWTGPLHSPTNTDTHN